MDWDDEIFSRVEFEAHFGDLGILGPHSVEDILTRTTETTRTGQEFGFKPIRLQIGTIANGRFHAKFTSEVDRSGTDVQTRGQLPSSFWIRFREEVRAALSSCSEVDSFCLSGSKSEHFVLDMYRSAFGLTKAGCSSVT